MYIFIRVANPAEATWMLEALKIDGFSHIAS